MDSETTNARYAGDDNSSEWAAELESTEAAIRRRQQETFKREVVSVGSANEESDPMYLASVMTSMLEHPGWQLINEMLVTVRNSTVKEISDGLPTEALHRKSGFLNAMVAILSYPDAYIENCIKIAKEQEKQLMQSGQRDSPRERMRIPRNL